jgi:putative transcriptional regulator
MIINKISEIMGKHRIRVEDIVRNTGLARNTVRGLYYGNVKRIDFDTLNRLCDFFYSFDRNLKLTDLIDYVHEEGESKNEDE